MNNNVVMIKRDEKGYYIFFFVKFILSLSFPYYALLFLGYFENLLINMKINEVNTNIVQAILTK